MANGRRSVETQMKPVVGFSKIVVSPVESVKSAHVFKFKICDEDTVVLDNVVLKFYANFGFIENARYMSDDLFVRDLLLFTPKDEHDVHFQFDPGGYVLVEVQIFLQTQELVYIIWPTQNAFSKSVVRNSIYMNYFFEPFNLLVCKGPVDKRNSKVFDVMVLRNDEFNTLALGVFLWKVYVIVELGERDVVLSRLDDDDVFLLKFCQNVELEMIETLKMKQLVKANSQVHPDQFTMSSDEVHQKTRIEPDVVEVDEDSSVQNIDHVGSTTNAFQSKEVENIDASVSSEIENMNQSNIQEGHEVAYEKDVPSVIILNHLHVQSVDCSHLGSGSFESTSVTGYSDPFISRSWKRHL